MYNVIQKGADGTDEARMVQNTYTTNDIIIQNVIILSIIEGLRIIYRMGQKDEFGMTKLHLSSLLGEHEKVKDLVENPVVNVNEDFNGMTPLHMAAYGYHVNVVKILLGDSPVDSSQKDSWGKSAIDLARERELHHQGLANESEYWLGLYMRSYTRDYKDYSYDAYDRERTRKLADEYKEEFEGHKNMVLRCKEIQKKLTTH